MWPRFSVQAERDQKTTNALGRQDRQVEEKNRQDSKTSWEAGQAEHTVERTGRTTEYIFLLEMKQGYSVSAHSAGAYTATLLVMVNVMRGSGRAPPTLTSLG
jgi:hypothetical protein